MADYAFANPPYGVELPGAPERMVASASALSVELADRSHCVFDALGIGVPERLELGLIQIGDVLAEIGHGLLELVFCRRLLRGLPPGRDDGSRGPLGRKQADP